MMAGTAVAALLLDTTGRFIWVGVFSAVCCLLIFPIVRLLVRERGTVEQAEGEAASQA